MASNLSRSLSLLNDQDLAVLRQVIDRERRRPQNHVGPSDSLSEDNQRSVVFALVPASGIPARASSSSTGTGTGTGTAVLNVGDYTLYGVECQLYREEWDDQITTPAGSGTSSADTIRATARRVLKEVPGWTELVFNPEATALAGPRLVPTTLSPWGTRVPIGMGTASAGHAVISFRVLSAGFFLGGVDNFCLRVQAEVLSVSCNETGVSPGDEVTIYDPGGCQFNVPIEILLGVRGTAVKMAWNDPTGLTVDLQGIPYCFLQATAEETEAFETAGECYWMVQSLCCVEDWYDDTE
jgi:hypothetical protein